MQHHLFSVAVLAVAPLFAQAPKGWTLHGNGCTKASGPDAAGEIEFVATGSM